MTSPIKLENHPNRQQYLQQQQQQHHHHHHHHQQPQPQPQHGAMGKNLHLSEVITTAAAAHTHHYNGIGTHRHTIVDPIEMTKLLSNITTSTNSSSKTIPISSTMDYSSRLNHFSWEEIEGRYLPVIFRNENDSMQRYTSKMYVENTLFQSESWQRHAILARSLPPLISYPYTENELKLFRLIVEWHLASFHFKTIIPSDCLIRFEDLLDFYGSLRKLRDSASISSFNRPLPPPPIPPLIPMTPPKQRIPSTSSSNGSSQSFELPIMGGSSSLKSHAHHRHPSSSSSSSSTKIYPPTVHHPHSANYLLQQNADLLIPFSNSSSSSSSSSQSFNFTPITPKPNASTLPPPPPRIPTQPPLSSSSSSSSSQWNDGLSKSNDKIRPPLPRPMIPMSNTPSSLQQEQLIRDKRLLSQKTSHQSIPTNTHQSRDTKESGWVQINNVFVPYIVKLKLRENELEKCLTRQPPPQLQREFYVPYEILIKCHIFSDNEFAFKKFLIKATQKDFDIFNSLISNINIFDEKVPEKTLLVNLYHVMMGLQRILYIKYLTTKQPRTQVNKYHAEVLTHKGGTLLMHGNKLVPYIVQNNRFYVPLVYAYHSLPHVLSQAKRGARAPRQYEIDFLNLLFIYFSIDSSPLTSDTLLVDAFSIKSSDLQTPIHFRTLAEHQQHERNKLLNTLMRITQTNNKLSNKTQQQQQQQSAMKSSSSNNKSTKCPPTNVVVNPLIHHPSFYGLSSSTSAIKQPVTTTTTPQLPPPPPPPTLTSNSVVINPLLLPSEFATKKKYQLKSITYDNHTLNALMKISDQTINNSKISIKQIFEEFSYDINYDKFIQWCQTNSLLPLIKLDDEEKQIENDYNNNNDDYYVYYRHLNRCIELLNDLKRGTISMTLLPSTNQETQQQQQQQQQQPIKSQLAGAKKRKTTIPTTRHIPHPLQPSSPSPSISTTINESNSNIQNNDHHLSSELPLQDELNHQINSTNDDVNHEEEEDDDDDDQMPIVDTVEEEQPIQSDMNSSFLIVDSNEGDDGKIHLDDTLPSCSSGYESAAALTNADNNTVNNPSSDDDDDNDETNSIIRSREHSSSCQSEQSLVPILSTVSSNIKLNDHETTELSPVILNQKNLNLRQRDKQGKFRPRSRSPTPRNKKKLRSSDEQLSSSTNTITSDQIEQHLRTLLMSSNNDQKRTRTRPIKTPTRLVEEIPAPNNNSIKMIEPDTNLFDMFSTSSSSSTTTTMPITDINSNETNKNQPEACTYNVTISNKPNKLGLTIKKVVQR